jgi:hypothetical protein
MPYQAAKAVAATFCYNIRWALTPVFGNDFLSLCIPPGAATYAKFFIDPAIVQYCTAETKRFREEGASYRVPTSNASSPTEIPNAQLVSPLWESNMLKQRGSRPADLKSGYRTDPNYNDQCIFSPEVSPLGPWTPLTGSQSPGSLSPQVSPRSHWKCVNRPQSPPTPMTATSSAMCSPINTHALPFIQEPSPASDEYCSEMCRTKRTHSKVALSDQGDNEAMTRPRTAGAVNSDSMFDADGAANFDPSQTDIGAAELLLLLRSGGRMLLPPTKRTRRGSTM